VARLQIERFASESDKFRDAESCCIEKLEHPPIPQGARRAIARRSQETPHISLAERLRQPPKDASYLEQRRRVRRNPAGLFKEAKQPAHCRHAPGTTPRRAASLGEPTHEGLKVRQPHLPEVRCSDLLEIAR